MELNSILREEIQMVDKYILKRVKPIKEMSIKCTLGFHITPLRMAKINVTKHNKYWQGLKNSFMAFSTIGGF